MANLKESLREDRLAWTEGEIIESAELFAITNTSTAGMAGSPLLVRDAEGWKVCGVLAGGPAVIGHYYLMKLARVCHDYLALREVLKEFKDIADTQAPGRYTVPGLLQCIELFSASLTKEKFINKLAGVFYEEIKDHYDYLKEQSGPDVAKRLMNHNLAVPMWHYIDRINFK